jgi:hypothetical protein
MLEGGCSTRNWAWFFPGPAYPVPRQLALESKPLFHPEALRQEVRAFNLHAPGGTGSPWQRVAAAAPCPAAE